MRPISAFSAFLLFSIFFASCSFLTDTSGDLPEIDIFGDTSLYMTVSDPSTGSTTYPIALSESSKAYTITILDQDGVEFDAPIVGMETDHKFALEPMSAEKAAEVLALESIIKAAGIAQLDSVPVTFNIGAAASQMALLRETPSRGANRIETDKLSGADYSASLISGGYILYAAMGKQADKSNEFLTALNFRISVEYPDEPNSVQLNYVQTAYNELEYAVSYSDMIPVDTNDVTLHYLVSVLLSLSPGESQECVLVKKRFDSTWCFGPFLDVSESSLVDSSYSAVSAVSAGTFLDIFVKKNTIESMISPTWESLRASNLSDSALSTYVLNAFNDVGLDYPCEKSLRLARRLIDRARFLDAQFD